MFSGIVAYKNESNGWIFSNKFKLKINFLSQVKIESKI